ncbi:putative oxidoreductase YbiC [Planctomycetes bacterium Pan216]|uniref:Putative oxidoreductase YbiC n=1 Tax=Kolteria novifilia TaxID=2527975 RepID=A0A518AYL9_9BACT|nr:putative oxidoreductase YbiC [Planctomycetes bacterium Pan216]
MPTLSFEATRDVARSLLGEMGAPTDHASIVADHLACCHLAGHDSHGLIRLPQYHRLVCEGQIVTTTEPRLEKETASTALIDGCWTWGQVVAKKATSVAMEKARSSGLAVVSARDCNHIGRLGAYALEAAEQGFVAKVWCNVHGIVRMAPWGGLDPRFGTNPLAIAIPRRGKPIVVDITTTAVAEGKVRLARNRGVDIPEGWILDKEGNATTNPADLYDGGTLLPFGGPLGHKGYGLALVVDLLGGALTGSGCGAMPGVRVGNGITVEVLDPGAMGDREEFLDRVESFVEYVQSSRPKPGVESILLPGEPEFRTEESRRRDGIVIDDGTWEQLGQVAADLGIKLPSA